ncbi:hypothetical protein GCM10029964_092050 [Kibdelosporangium lantanae]
MQPSVEVDHVVEVGGEGGVAAGEGGVGESAVQVEDVVQAVVQGRLGGVQPHVHEKDEARGRGVGRGSWPGFLLAGQSGAEGVAGEVEMLAHCRGGEA